MIGVAKKRILSANYNEKIDIYIKETSEAWDDKEADILVTSVLASVKKETGYMMLQYQNQGIVRPVTIECNYLGFFPSKIVWQGREITIASAVDADDSFKRRTRLLGSFVNDSKDDAVTGLPFIPMKSHILRRLSKKRGTDLVDSINNANAQILLPVSEFDGVDRSVVTVNIINSSIDNIELFFKTNDDQTLRDIFAIGNFVFAVTFGRRIRVYHKLTGGRNYTAIGTCEKNTLYKLSVVVNFDTGLVVLNLNDIEVWNAVIGGDYSTTQTTFRVSSSVSNRAFNGYIWDVNVNNELYIPLPHLSIGFDAQGNKVDLAVTGGVTEGFGEQGTSYYQDADTTRLNTSSALLVLFEQGQLQEEYTFFDTSNTVIWKNNFEWNTSIITQSFIDSNIQDTYKNRLFIIIKDSIIDDIILYDKPLTGINLLQMKKFIKHE